MTKYLRGEISDLLISGYVKIQGYITLNEKYPNKESAMQLQNKADMITGEVLGVNAGEYLH
jgi:hypothetical protein